MFFISLKLTVNTINKIYNQSKDRKEYFTLDVFVFVLQPHISHIYLFPDVGQSERKKFRKNEFISAIICSAFIFFSAALQQKSTQWKQTIICSHQTKAFVSTLEGILRGRNLESPCRLERRKAFEEKFKNSLRRINFVNEMILMEELWMIERKRPSSIKAVERFCSFNSPPKLILKALANHMFPTTLSVSFLRQTGSLAFH